MPLRLKGKFFSVFSGALSELNRLIWGQSLPLKPDITRIPFQDTSERVAYCYPLHTETKQTLIVFSFNTFFFFFLAPAMTECLMGMY